jgi:hypothetical protein
MHGRESGVSFPIFGETDGLKNAYEAGNKLLIKN